MCQGLTSVETVKGSVSASAYFIREPQDWGVTREEREEREGGGLEGGRREKGGGEEEEGGGRRTRPFGGKGSRLEAILFRQFSSGNSLPASKQGLSASYFRPPLLGNASKRDSPAADQRSFRGCLALPNPVPLAVIESSACTLHLP